MPSVSVFRGVAPTTLTYADCSIELGPIAVQVEEDMVGIFSVMVPFDTLIPKGAQAITIGLVGRTLKGSVTYQKQGLIVFTQE